jgi:hypothetical protein
MTTNCSIHPSSMRLCAQRAGSTIANSLVLKVTFGLLFVACCVTQATAAEDAVNTHENRQQGPAPKKITPRHSGAHQAPSPHAFAVDSTANATHIHHAAKPHSGNAVAATSTTTSAGKNANNGAEHGIIFVGGHAQQPGATHALNPQPIPPGHAPDNKRTPPGPPTRTHSGHAAAHAVENKAADAGLQH